jgi:DHA1 family bicyclomycin/chloramphenicol resistance-like MFS transporter
MPLVLAALCATGPLGIDMYLPSIPDMAIALASSEGAVQLSLMTFFVGLMLGQLAYGPLSDKFGRKPMIYLGLGIFILGSVGCALAQSVVQLQWLRFLQGLGGSIGMVIAFAIVKDAFSGAKMGKMMSLILAVLSLSPVVAPMLGNALQGVGSWRTIFWALAIYGALVVAACAILLPETRNTVDRQNFVLSRTLQNYGKILIDKNFLPFALALCIAQAGFFAYIAGSASVFITEYDLSPTQFSLLFGANALGLLFAAVVNTPLHHRFGPLMVYRAANTVYFIVLGLLMAYLLSGHSNLIVLSAGLFVTVSLLGFIMPTGSQLALMQQRQHAGTASALIGSMQFSAGSIIIGISGAIAHWGGFGLILVMLICAAVSALICLTAFPRKIEM